MRTTLDIDDDVLLAVKERARRHKTSAGRVMSDLARQSLTARLPLSGTEFCGFRPLPKRDGVVVTNELIDRLRDEAGV